MQGDDDGGAWTITRCAWKPIHRTRGFEPWIRGMSVKNPPLGIVYENKRTGGLEYMRLLG